MNPISGARPISDILQLKETVFIAGRTDARSGISVQAATSPGRGITERENPLRKRLKAVQTSEPPLKAPPTSDRQTCRSTPARDLTKTSCISKFSVVCIRNICYRSNPSDVEAVLIITFAFKASSRKSLCGSQKRSQNDQQAHQVAGRHAFSRASSSARKP